jgi:hypothetical protein
VGRIGRGVGDREAFQVSQDAISLVLGGVPELLAYRGEDPDACVEVNAVILLTVVVEAAANTGERFEV